MGRASKRKEARLLKLDFGCGKSVREGFEGVDVRPFGQKWTIDLTKRWPWADSSVEQANASHFVEHLKPKERVHFVNELFRVLTPGGKCQVVTPHWASGRAFGDLTHEWPPVSEYWFYYLLKSWRDSQAPHNDGYACDFDAVWGYALRPDIAARAQDYQVYALNNYKEAAQDLVATLTSRKGA